MKQFKSKKSSYIYILLLCSAFFPLVILYITDYKMLEKPWTIALTSLPLCLATWISLGTSYTIKDDHLYYRSAFIKGKIDISRICEVVKGKTAWTGIRPATASNGLTIKFNSYDEIYISPQEEDLFIEKLQQINGKIKVTQF